MTDLLYIRIDLSVPEAKISHVAELAPISASECEIKRIVELDASGRVTGAGTDKLNAGMQVPALKVVPHPDLYADYPDIETQPITAVDFNSLWLRAITAFPQLTETDTKPHH